MLNTALDRVDHVARPVVAIGTEYLPGRILERHNHRRAQFLYGMTGSMDVQTDDGMWSVPPFSGVWIPPLKMHRVVMHGVSTRSLYIEPEHAPRNSTTCEVVRVGSLFHQLLLVTAQLPALYDEDGRDGALIDLIMHELRSADPLPVFAPIPRDPSLSRLCKAFLHSPSVASSPEEWARRLNTSPRTFARLFHQQTGLTFSHWRKQACLLAALSRLTAGESVTQVALDLGYESPSAFSTMFRKALGESPTDFVRRA